MLTLGLNLTPLPLHNTDACFQTTATDCTFHLPAGLPIPMPGFVLPTSAVEVNADTTTTTLHTTAYYALFGIVVVVS